MVALILIFIYLLLRHRASQREIRLRAAAEIDPTPTPFDPVDTREGLGRHVSINDGGSELPTRTGALCLCFALAVPVILTTHRFV